MQTIKIAEYILYMMDFVTETNKVDAQLNTQLNKNIIGNLKQLEKIPKKKINNCGI